MINKVVICNRENIQRENLSPIEEANAYKTLIDTYDVNQTELANKVGKTVDDC